MLLPADFRTGLRLLLRARFVVLGGWALAAIVLGAYAASLFSGRQPATVGLDLGLSLIRLCLPIIGVLMLQELISREFERKLFHSTLTYPRPRHHFLLGRLAALGVSLALLLLVLAGALAALTHWISTDYAQTTRVALGLHYWITVGFILLDLYVILSLGALLAVVASTPSFILIGTLGFMLVARSFSTVITLLQRQSWLVDNAETYGGSLGLLSYLLPDLAALDVRTITLYGQMALLPPQWPWHIGSTVVYCVALVALAAWALTRKRFA